MKKYIMLLGLCLTMKTHANSNPSYIYESGAEETKRLNLQNDLIKTSSVEHLQKAGLKPGQKVIDVGCGSGAMTTYLAEQVGPAGHVYALDIDQKQLDVTRKALAEKKLNNVTFIQCDIEEENPKALSGILGTIDLAYMRFVGLHLKHPERATKNIFSILKKNGCVVNQESIMGTTHCEPENSALVQDYYTKSVELGNKLGTDKNMGTKLSNLYTKAGFTEDTYYKKTLSLPVKDTVFGMLRTYAAQKDYFQKYNLMAEADLEKYKAELTRLSEVNDQSLVFDQGYIIARK